MPNYNVPDPFGRPPLEDGPAWDEDGICKVAWRKFFNAVYTHILAIIPAQPGGLPVFASNADAIAGGIPIGEFYRTNADPSLVAVVYRP